MPIKTDKSIEKTIGRKVKAEWATSHTTMLSAQTWIDEMDIVARDLERHWGVDRLRLLVEPDLREKFDRQRYLVNHALETGSIEDVKRECQRMVKAWRACDRAAHDAGHRRLSPEVWEIGLADGSVLALCRSTDDAHAYRADGRATVVWTLDEVAQMVSGQHFVQSVKREFPGAAVVAARAPVDPLRGTDAVGRIDDPIPF
jgi:hypothetical protein